MLIEGRFDIVQLPESVNPLLRLLLALRDVRANGNVLNGFSVFAKVGNDRRIHPIIRAVLGFVFDFTFPNPAAANRRPDAANEFLGVISELMMRWSCPSNSSRGYLEMAQNLSLT